MRALTASRVSKALLPGRQPQPSPNASGEEYGDTDEKGRRDTGRKGGSQRPSGTKDAAAKTGVDPQDPPPGR
ncbi:hypothetical protein OIE52_08900 [Streptomyces canus]|uniref:hypothetical protein n=1 Tax=Streptomyces canus TaxID=58343 RepID=UPI00324CD730